MGVFNPKVQELQRLLNSKFKLSLVDDGKYGPKTADAIYKNIQSILKPKVTSATNTSSVPQTQDTQKLIQQTANQSIVK
jgi:peptidoglycan hydrolase-like protein with peptidoglycan-binding domain